MLGRVSGPRCPGAPPQKRGSEGRGWFLAVHFVVAAPRHDNACKLISSTLVPGVAMGTLFLQAAIPGHISVGATSAAQARSFLWVAIRDALAVSARWSLSSPLAPPTAEPQFQYPNPVLDLLTHKHVNMLAYGYVTISRLPQDGKKNSRKY